MNSLKALIAAVMLTAVGTVAAPQAHAAMQQGNYDVLTNRYTQASWVWFVTICRTPDQSVLFSAVPNCFNVSAMPRLKYYAYYGGDAYLVDGRYTLTVDVDDGLRCTPGYSMPTRDTYTWDPVTLAGEINSTYDVGCFNGPPGTQFWTFALQRL